MNLIGMCIWTINVSHVHDYTKFRYAVLKHDLIRTF